MRDFLEESILGIGCGLIIVFVLAFAAEAMGSTPKPTPAPLVAEDVFPKALKEHNLKLCIKESEQPRLCQCMSDTLLEVLLLIQVPLRRLHEAPPHILNMVKDAVMGTCAPLFEEKSL